MSGAIEFYFEFSSPYGYIASHLVDGLGERTGRAVTWRPILLGPVFKATGQAPLVDVPLKGDYSKRDFPRMARYHGIAYAQPAKFPIGTVAGVRAFYWLHDRDPKQAVAFAKALYADYFSHGIDISASKAVVAAAKGVGADVAALSAALQDPAVKDRARQEVEAAIAAGVFGSPYLVVDGEPFWGCDRIPLVEEWILRGGW